MQIQLRSATSQCYDSNTRIFDLTNMNSKPIRVTSVTVTQTQVYKGGSPCKNYSEESGNSDKGSWRMPNQRELMLIVSYVDQSNTTLSRTRSSLSKVKGRANFGSVFYQQSNGIITLDEGQDNTFFKVRCVKDVRNK